MKHKKMGVKSPKPKPIKKGYSQKVLAKNLKLIKPRGIK